MQVAYDADHNKLLMEQSHSTHLGPHLLELHSNILNIDERRANFGLIWQTYLGRVVCTIKKKQKMAATLNAINMFNEK